MRPARLARLCYRRRRLTVPAWIAGTIAVLVPGFGFAADPLNDFSSGDSGSAKADRLLDEHFPAQSGDSVTLAVRADGGVRAPDVRRGCGGRSSGSAGRRTCPR